MSLGSFLANAKAKVSKVVKSPIVKAAISTTKPAKAISTISGIGKGVTAYKNYKQNKFSNAFGANTTPTAQQQANLTRSANIVDYNAKGKPLPYTKFGQNLAIKGLGGVGRGLENAASGIGNAARNIGQSKFANGVNTFLTGMKGGDRYGSYGGPSASHPSATSGALNDQPALPEGYTPGMGQDPTLDRQAQINALANDRAMTDTLAYDAAGGAMANQDQQNQDGDWTVDDFLNNERETNYDSMLADLQDQIDQLNDAGPSDLENQFNGLSDQEQTIKDNMNNSLREISGQAIPYQFITGQGARIQNLANTDLDRLANQQATLQDRIDQESARRAAKIDALNQKYNQLLRQKQDQEDRRYEQAKYKREQNDKAIRSVGGGLFNVNTGKWVVSPKGSSGRRSSGGGVKLIKVGNSLYNPQTQQWITNPNGGASGRTG